MQKKLRHFVDREIFEVKIFLFVSGTMTIKGMKNLNTYTHYVAVLSSDEIFLTQKF